MTRPTTWRQLEQGSRPNPLMTSGDLCDISGDMSQWAHVIISYSFIHVLYPLVPAMLVYASEDDGNSSDDRFYGDYDIFNSFLSSAPVHSLQSHWYHPFCQPLAHLLPFSCAATVEATIQTTRR